MFEHMDVLDSLEPLRNVQMPLHIEAENALRGLINHPALAEGGLLPDEISLANRLGVGRGTIRAALSRLVTDGLLERKSGVGTRVVRPAAESAVTAWRSLSREMARRNVVVQLFRLQLETETVSPEVADALRISQNANTLRLDRVRGWEGVPVLRSRSWFHPRVQFDKDEPFDKPLYDIIAARTGLVATRAYEQFGAEAASSELAADLEIAAGAPLLLRRHTVFDQRDRPLELAEIHYVSPRFMLTLDLHRDNL
jgi:GntR family transcriptional regulator